MSGKLPDLGFTPCRMIFPAEDHPDHHILAKLCWDYTEHHWELGLGFGFRSRLYDLPREVYLMLGPLTLSLVFPQADH